LKAKGSGGQHVETLVVVLGVIVFEPLGECFHDRFGALELV